MQGEHRSRKLLRVQDSWHTTVGFPDKGGGHVARRRGVVGRHRRQRTETGLGAELNECITPIECLDSYGTSLEARPIP